jgi:hypothetical protein
MKTFLICNNSIHIISSSIINNNNNNNHNNNQCQDYVVCSLRTEVLKVKLEMSRMKTYQVLTRFTSIEAKITKTCCIKQYCRCISDCRLGLDW